MKKNILHITTTHTPFDGRIFQKELRTLSTEYNCYQIVANKFGTHTNTKNKLKADQYNDTDGIKTIYISRTSRITLFHYIISLIRLFSSDLYYFLLDYILPYRINGVINEYKIQPEIIHYHDLELSNIICKINRKLKAKIIFDSHEFFFTYPLSKPVKNSKIKKSITVFKKYTRAVKESNYTITVTDTMNELVSFIRNDSNNSVISNSSIFPVCRDSKAINKSKKITLVHEGFLRFNRGLKIMMDLFSDPFIKENIRLKIIGDIYGEEKEYFMSKMKEYSLTEDNIIVTGWIDYNELHTHFDGDIGIIFFEKELNTYLGMPNKLFNYIARGLPILSTKCYDSSKIIDKYGIGKIVDRNKESIIQGIKELVNDYTKYHNNVIKYQDVFLWKNDMIKLIEVYKNI